MGFYETLKQGAMSRDAAIGLVTLGVLALDAIVFVLLVAALMVLKL